MKVKIKLTGEIYEVLAIDFTGVSIRKGVPSVIIKENDGCLSLNEVEVLSEVVQDPMVNIQNIRDICDELDGNCSACPLGTKEGCPFLSEDPMNWDVGYINERHAHSPFNKNTGVTGNTRIIRVTSCLHDCPKYQLSDKVHYCTAAMHVLTEKVAIQSWCPLNRSVVVGTVQY